jgi:hypothetical protein
MRPKASQQNLQIAAAFANAVTIQDCDTKHFNTLALVNCKGSCSIFAALSVCIPDIVRWPEKHDLFGTAGVSEIELNKFLARSGYTSVRHRNRIKGTNDKWTKGFQRWKNRRWADARNFEELRQLWAQLAEIPIRFSVSYSINKSELEIFLLNLLHYPGACDRGLEPEGEPDVDDCPWRQGGSLSMAPFACSADGSSPWPIQPAHPPGAFQLAEQGRGGGATAPRYWRVEPIPLLHFATHHRCAWVVGAARIGVGADRIGCGRCYCHRIAGTSNKRCLHCFTV